MHMSSLLRLWLLSTLGFGLALGFGLGACNPPPPKVVPRRTAQAATPDPLQLELGRPGHPGGLVRLRRGERLDTLRGQKLSWDALARRLARARVVFVGERHDHRHHHRIQAALLRRLAAAPGAGRLHVGLEMLFRRHAPAALHRWVTGTTDEATFLKEVDWKRQWGMDFGYYRPVFTAARKHRLPMAGLNVPLRIARTVGRRGLGALTPKVRATLPRLHLTAPRHRQVFRAMLGLPPRASRPHGRRPHGHRPHSRRPHGHPHPGFMDRLFSAQVLRDEVMAAEIVKTLEAAGPRARMVVIVGNGHLFYHTGVNHRLRRLRPRWPQATVICVSAGPKGRQVSRGLGDILVGTALRAPRPTTPPRPAR